ncbi:MAG: hypothetical protein V3T72_22160 [Thermoanaerobaculia bacterium]
MTLGSLLIVATVHRSSWAGTAAGEATYLMQAESLARDFDLTYTRADFDRQLLRWYSDPADLALISGSEGRRITFDRPFPYALWLAPFVALWPKAGAAVANGLLLALASLLASLALRPQAGGWAPLWVMVMVFGSAVFAFVVPATGEVFLLAATVVAFSLLIGVRAWGGGFLAGALLAIPLATDWLYALLLAAAWWVPAADAASADGRPAVRRGLALGAASMLAAIVLVHWLAGGGLLFASSGFRFTAATGYPLVDFTAGEWSSTIRHFEDIAAGAGTPFRWDPELRLWSFVDLLFGRSIGLVPYFAPLILLLGGGSTRGFRRPIAVAAGVWLAAVVVLRPFAVAGGSAGLANPLFLPFFGALWLVQDRRRRRRRLAAGAAATALVAALFMGELWRHPGAAAARPGAGGGHETAAARRWLAYETSQRWRLGGAVAELGDLAVAAVGDAAWVEARHQRVMLDGGAAELVISASRPLTAVRVDLEGAAAEQLRLRGGRIEPLEDPRDRESSSRLVLTGVRRRHSSWWSSRRSYQYVLALELPPSSGAVSLRLGEAADRGSE